MAMVKKVKVVKPEAPDASFWLAQVLWFVLIFFVAIAALAFWWDWGLRWIDYGGTIVLPSITFAILLAELWAIVYFKITVPNDDNNAQ